VSGKSDLKRDVMADGIAECQPMLHLAQLVLHLIEEVWFAFDSPLEEAGFEPLVPRGRPVSSCCRSRSRRLFRGRGCNRHNPIFGFRRYERVTTVMAIFAYSAAR
jgi:hypothetical protein